MKWRGLVRWLGVDGQVHLSWALNEKMQPWDVNPIGMMLPWTPGRNVPSKGELVQRLIEHGID
jgi:hypothetical protein